MSGREVVGRAPSVLAFALLLLLCVAAPGLAEEAVDSPQAEAEREASQLAFADLSAGEEEQLLREQFEVQLKSIEADPARLLDDVVLERIDSPTEALVTLDGQKLLLEAEVPLRVREEDGALNKVELGLEETADGYEPANPLVDLTLPATSDEPIEIGDEGLEVSIVGADDTSASPMGEGDLFLPAVHEDTSLLLSPIARGVEISALLASRNSPEQLAFELALPQGTALHATEAGGAEIVDDEGGVLATVTAPYAVDAQGTEVPVTLGAEGHSLFLDVAHRQMDVAYPLFVDPEITENWTGFTDTSKLSYWKWSWSGVGSEDYIGKTSCIVTCWGNGLYVRSRSSFSYPKGSWGRWWFVPQGSTTYMYRVVVGPMNYDAHGCTANEPHPYVGVWNDSSGWKVLSNAYPSGWGSYIDTGGQELGAGTRTAFVGIEAASGANISCGHDYRLGGAMLFLEDPEKPTAGAPWGYPTGWVKSGDSFTINAPASDPGLGVYGATLSPGGSPPVEKKHGCDGHYANPCPSSYTFQFPIGAASFDEGEKQVSFSALDARDKSSTYAWMMKVDRTPPEITLGGQLAEATDETEGDAKDDKDRPLVMPVYNLTVDTTDGRVGTVANPVLPAEKRSGVKKIEVFLDGGSTPLQTWEASSCTAGNCPLSKVFTLKLNELSADTDHYLRILARDFAGNAPRERKLEFEYIPATGMKDEYVMQYFPLPDGSGNESEEEHPRRPELAVNLLSGNLVYRQQDAEVEGPGADLGVELFYNSLLPESQNTEWGDGWALAQAPELEIDAPGGSGPPTEATIVDESGGVESSIDLPVSTGGESFDKTLQATVTKEAGGGYELADESGETGTAYVFDAAGQIEEARTGTAATVDYESEGGNLSEISVEDPATVKVDPETIDEEEVFPDLAARHSTNYGTLGSADGQLKAPADVVLDAQGNSWVADRGNDRIEKFSPSGQFLAKFGSTGSGDGQLREPTALTFDAAGNLWVADYGNARVQKFSPGGQFLSKFGTGGLNNGQLAAPNGIAIDSKGNVWIADSLKVQRFTSSGTFIKRVGTISAPEALAADGKGNVYVADGTADRIVVYDEEGNQLRTFGSSGTGPGQFTNPAEVALDPEGNVWVGDNKANNVQLFNSAGDYITRFGAAGAGAEQFALNQWMGIAADGQGRVWVGDGGNNRVSEWLLGNHQPDTSVISEDDPHLDVDVSEGLVDSVEGEEVGSIDYTHSGDLLTAVTAPDGKASFTYDSAGRMTKVTLANGTYGQIAYEATYGRVKSVTVAVEGKNAKTTYFAYSDEPRRTTVTPPDAPATTYEIAADGSIFKWWNTKAPPVFDDVAGTLYDPNNRETSQPIAVGVHTLLVQAHDDEGLASIQVVANNDQLVDEKICQYPSEPSKCVSMANEWVTETGSWPPGILYLEVIATDRLGEASSRRFWVNIPYTPPPDPEAEEPPRYNEILSFREEFGLDLDLKGDEMAINDRIFDLMGAWHNPSTPDGEVARATAAKWGVPLRSVDAAELEYREEYLSHNASVIGGWGESQASSSFAGFYMDHRAGGQIRVGFTSNGQQRLEELKQQSGIEAADRLALFTIQPSQTLDQLRTLSRDFDSKAFGKPNIQASISSGRLNLPDNRISLGSNNVSLLTSYLNETYGSTTAFQVYFEPKLATSREQSCLAQYSPRARRIDDRLFAGDWIRSTPGHCGCTLGFGAWTSRQGAQGQIIKTEFGLTAGHCWSIGATVRRAGYVLNSKGEKVEGQTNSFGSVTRRSNGIERNGFETDSEAIRLSNWISPPRRILQNRDGRPLVNGAGDWIPGMVLCLSGTYGGSRCGPTKPELLKIPYEEEGPYPTWQIVVKAYSECGDSGGPIWDPRTGSAVALLTGGPGCETGPTWVTPLFPLEGKAYLPEVTPGSAPGVLRAPEMDTPKELNIMDGVK